MARHSGYRFATAPRPPISIRAVLPVGFAHLVRGARSFLFARTNFALCAGGFRADLDVSILPGFAKFRICAFRCRALFVFPVGGVVLVPHMSPLFAGWGAVVIVSRAICYPRPPCLLFSSLGGAVVVFPGGAMGRKDKTGQDTTGQNRTRHGKGRQDNTTQHNW